MLHFTRCHLVYFWYRLTREQKLGFEAAYRTGCKCEVSSHLSGFSLQPRHCSCPMSLLTDLSPLQSPFLDDPCSFTFLPFGPDLFPLSLSCPRPLHSSLQLLLVPRPLLFFSVQDRGYRQELGNPISPSTPRFSPASSAGITALNLTSESAYGNKRAVTTKYGKETFPRTPCVSPPWLGLANGPVSRTINTKPQLQQLLSSLRPK